MKKKQKNFVFSKRVRLCVTGTKLAVNHHTQRGGQETTQEPPSAVDQPHGPLKRVPLLLGLQQACIGHLLLGVGEEPAAGLPLKGPEKNWRRKNGGRRGEAKKNPCPNTFNIKFTGMAIFWQRRVHHRGGGG